MIWESYVWKVELKRDLGDLRRRLQHAATPRSRGITEQVLAKIEKFVFASAFVVRKLIEAKKLSDELEAATLLVRSFPRIDLERSIDFLNWHRLDEFYDLTNPSTACVIPRDLCNLLIHSLVFSPILTGDGRYVSGFLFNSDRIKDTVLFEITLETYLNFIESVIQDDVANVSYDRRTRALMKSRG